ncbi:hypothetical protein BSFA1_74490 (plasmid) [Burkholderia sp. SFA1]|nr:hypothetical protein BSFA1_74490 [Burkholderia sp. SFA1]
MSNVSRDWSIFPLDGVKRDASLQSALASARAEPSPDLRRTPIRQRNNALVEKHATELLGKGLEDFWAAPNAALRAAAWQLDARPP